MDDMLFRVISIPDVPRSLFKTVEESFLRRYEMPRVFAIAVSLLTAGMLYVFPEQGVPFLVAVVAGMLVVVVERALRAN